MPGRSRAAGLQLPALTETFDATRGRVSLMASHRDTWPAAPCDLPVTAHTVKAAWFAAGFDPHMIRLFSYGAGRWDLLVVPPRTDTATAARLMAAAADPALHLTASELLTAERRLHTEDEAEREPGRTEHWEDEGGALRRPPTSLAGAVCPGGAHISRCRSPAPSRCKTCPAGHSQPDRRFARPSADKANVVLAPQSRDALPAAEEAHIQLRPGPSGSPGGAEPLPRSERVSS
ncbi:DUF5994 family protein [Streptomyces sp. NPDC013978]|uniref:DUF5994 family protein n=1 Tax=Streptomyces sp. NPDC013978 TaxID=3364869 RepID=UPI0036F83B0B